MKNGVFVSTNIIFDNLHIGYLVFMRFVMSAKEYLSRVRLLTVEIRADKARLKELDESIGWIKAIDYSKERIQASGDNVDLSGKVAELVELQNKVAAEMSKLQREKQRIISEIRQLGNADYITLLTMRYVECARWEKIAVDMGLTLRRVYQLHGDALQAFRVSA